MGLTVNTNIAAHGAYRHLSVTDGQMSRSLEKLSSGLRINRAADDAAGLAISEGLRSQIGGLTVALRNTQDGISVVQTAEGALTETHSILQRMRDLSVQAANDGGLTDEAKRTVQAEIGTLRDELDRIAAQTTWNGKKLLDGSFATVFQVGSGRGDTLPVTIGTAMDALGLGVAGVDVARRSGTYAAAAGTVPDPGQAAVSGVSDDTSAVFINWQKPTGAADFHGPGYDALTWSGLDGVVSFGGRSFDLGSVDFDPTDDTDGNGTVDSDDLLAQLNAAARSALGLTRDPFRPPTVGSEGVLSFVVREAVPGYTDDPTNAGVGTALSNSAADRARATPVFTPSSGAPAAIEAIDAAIATVSLTRADLGAVQNRLEHAGRATGVTLENLTASESRIRDADMAEEMVRFTRNQVLSQAGTAMLAQSGQVAKGVLALLS